jgi:hypothetical protein
MKDVLVELFSSKKFIAMIAGVLATVLLRLAGKFNVALDPDTAKQAADAVALLVASYCVGQGVADHGKEAAKITSQAPQSAEAAK